jgi:hypothetical protein
MPHITNSARGVCVDGSKQEMLHSRKLVGDDQVIEPPLQSLAVTDTMVYRSDLTYGTHTFNNAPSGNAD